MWEYRFSSNLDVPIEYSRNGLFVPLYEEIDACIWSNCDTADWIGGKRYSLDAKAIIVARYRLKRYEDAIIADKQVSK